METMLGVMGVAVVTSLALLVALAIESALLYGMLRLIEPATLDRRPLRLPVAHGTRLVARAFGNRA